MAIKKNRHPIVNIDYDDRRSLYVPDVIVPKLYIPNSCYDDVYKRTVVFDGVYSMTWELLHGEGWGKIKRENLFRRPLQLKWLRRAVQKWLLEEYDVNVRGVRITKDLDIFYILQIMLERCQTRQEYETNVTWQDYRRDE
jgi:hypothetical protein